jgi:hypothetical protein
LRQSDGVSPPGGSDWGLEQAQEEAASYIARQLDAVVAEDQKSGLVFAYVGALLVASAAVPHKGEPALSFFLAAITLGLLGLAFSVLALYPTRIKDPPDPITFADDLVAGLYARRFVIQTLLQIQLEAVKFNDRRIERKVQLQVLAAAFALGGTLMLIAEAIYG